MKTPKTIEEWQNVVNLADMLLGIDSARQYGLIQGGSAVNVIRCKKIIELGALEGVTPVWSADHAAAFIGEIASEEMGTNVPCTARSLIAHARAKVAAERGGRDEGAPYEQSDDDTPSDGSPTSEGSQHAGR